MGNNKIPTMYEWMGGSAALERLSAVFYRTVLADPLIGPLFQDMPTTHPHHVALWLGEVFRGPETYTNEQGGYPHMLSKHLGLGLREEQRARWVALMGAAADAAELPSDPEFRSAFVAYLEWGSRIALANTQVGATPPPEAPVPHWGWGEAPPYTPSKE